MPKIKSSKEYENLIIALAFTAALMIFTGILFDHYYEFNDDVLMKDILSGAYSGRPGALNVQMLSPISAFISFFYRIVPSLPWYGLFLCAFQYVSIGLVIYRASLIANGVKYKLVAAFIVVLFAISVFLSHLVMIQYTVTVAVMSASAIFWFYTIPTDVSRRDFLKQIILPVIILILAFQLRTEMLLLLFPFLGAALIARFSRIEAGHKKEEFIRYLYLAGFVFAGMALSFVINSVSYSSDEWKTFMEEFDARTKVYDYQYVPEYSANKDFYDSIGLSESQVELLTNYDYGIDERIDAEALSAVASYADELRGEGFAVRFPSALKEYIYKVTHLKGGVYGITLFLLYMLLIVVIVTDSESSVKERICRLIFRAVVPLCMRSVSWMYIVYGRREPDRITHPLYFVEILLLAVMLHVELSERTGQKSYLKMAAAVFFTVGGLIFLPGTISDVNSGIKTQEEINLTGRSIDKYCKEHPENFYYEDVYSTIINGETFNEKMFKDVDNGYKNYDLIGGWIMNSPLYRNKISLYGITSASEALLDMDNVFIISSDENGTEWIKRHYEDIGTDVTVTVTDTITEGYNVYTIKRHR
ncbi:MAG: hypothetical protein K6G12_04505 [Lachnospiraceae bacterium]|nr:hypothetical protein [Lachnospiraceae bacterium]